MHSMIVVGSQYWNECYGDVPFEVSQDEEGMQTLESLTINMKFVIDALKDVPKPQKLKYIHTNFIRND